MNAKYKGWGSYETWLVNETCVNDPRCVEFWREIALDHWATAIKRHPYREHHAYNMAVLSLASVMAQSYHNAPRIAHIGELWSELIGIALGAVFWNQIAEAWIIGIHDHELDDEII